MLKRLICDIIISTGEPTSFKKNTLDSDCYNKEAFRLFKHSTLSFANLAAQSA
ncbi:hypothetical protein BJ165DRAFT_1509031 [Panaeolus papilionaceus]|nr:hypothetical protein BJ165DRAFT_1509031 [Panaeolus papilionaceus]